MKIIPCIIGVALIVIVFSYQTLAAEREDESDHDSSTNNTERTVNLYSTPDKPATEPETGLENQASTVTPVVPLPASAVKSQSDTPAKLSEVNHAATINSNLNSGTTIPETANSNLADVPTTPAATSAPASENVPAINADPAAQTPPAVSQTDENKPLPWAWMITRVFGISSYLLLTILSLFGMLLTTGSIYRLLSPAAAWSMHRAVASTLLFSVAAHIAALLFDPFIKLSYFDVLVPFASIYRPLLLGLGIIGFYLLLLILATSLYHMASHARFWRTVHAFSFVLFVLIFLHGILIGTDSKQIWMQVIYWATGGLVASAGIYRLYWRYRSSQNFTNTLPTI